MLSPDLPGAWIYRTRLVDAHGHTVSTAAASRACPELRQPADTAGALRTCVTRLSATYHGVVTYQPASRYWLFQCLETGIFLCMAVALTVFCFYWLRRRAD